MGKKKKKRTPAKKGGAKGSNNNNNSSNQPGPSPKAAQSDTKHASEQVPILSSAGQGKGKPFKTVPPEGKSVETAPREEEPVSLFSDRLPFASPTCSCCNRRSSSAFARIRP